MVASHADIDDNLLINSTPAHLEELFWTVVFTSINLVLFSLIIAVKFWYELVASPQFEDATISLNVIHLGEFSNK